MTPEERIRQRVEEDKAILDRLADDEEEPDRSHCPYFAVWHHLPWKDREGAFGPGTCGGGCWEEPACITEQPLEGWPRMRHTKTHEHGAREHTHAFADAPHVHILRAICQRRECDGWPTHDIHHVPHG